MAVYVLRNETLTGSGTIVGELEWTRYGNGVIPPEDPNRNGQSEGSCSITGAGSFSFQPYEIVTGSSPSYSYEIGWEVTVTDAVGGTTTDQGGSTYSPGSGGKTYISLDSTGEWEASIDCELCLEVTDPTTPSGTGSNAVNYNPDPPHGREYRLFYRRRNGGSYSISADLGSASASRSGTFTNSTEIGIPDYIIGTVEAFAQQSADDTPFAIAGQISGTWRSAQIAQSISASDDHGEAYANNTDGVKVIAECLSDPIGDSGSAYATRTLAVPLIYSLDAQLRAMENDYPETLTLEYERAGTTVEVSATGSYSDSNREYRSESSEVWVKGNGTTEDEDEYTLASNWGAISIGIKSSSASTESEPTTDLKLLLKDKVMDALSIETPERSGNLTGSDTALGGSPWGVQRSFTGNTPAWQGLMGWRYLELVVAETGGASAGAAVTIKIGSKSWTKDSTGATLTAPGSGNTATWIIDLCSPSSETAATDTTDTTYPYAQDWSADGGGEDSYPRTGTGPYAGPVSTTTIRIEVGSSRTFTITTIKGKRTIASTIYCTNLPAHQAWVEQRPATVVSEADTTTYHKVRQSYEVDLEGRLIAAEWSDTEWDTTVGGASGIYTHTVYQRSIEWLANRINAAVLCPGWSATIAAPTTSTVWYNRDREMHGILGGGRWWRPPASPTLGSWETGIDATQRTQALGAITIPWQGGFTRLSNCPGAVGDVFSHSGTDALTSLILKAAKVLRTQGVGLSLTSAGLSDTSSTLTLTQASTARGTGNTDTNGYAQTGLPYGRGAGGDITLDFDGGTGGTYSAKGRKRRHFRAKPATTGGGGIRLAVSPTDRVTRGFSDNSPAVLVLGFAGAPVAVDWTDYETTLQTEDFWIDYTKTGTTALVVIYVDGSGNVQRTTTTDEGETFAVATTIFTSAKHPCFVVSPTGVEYHFAWFTGGTIKTRVYDAQGAEMIALTTVVASGVDDDQLAAEWRDGWVILGYVAGGTVTTVKSQDGETYS